MSQPGEVGRRGLPRRFRSIATRRPIAITTTIPQQEHARRRHRPNAPGSVRADATKPGTVVPKMNWSQARAVRRNAVSSSCRRRWLREVATKWTARKGPAQRGAVSVAGIGNVAPARLHLTAGTETAKR